MLKLFQERSPFSVIALLFIAIIVKLFWLMHPELIFVSENERLWSATAAVIQPLLLNNAFIITLLALVNIVGQAIFLNKLSNNAMLFNSRNYLPAFCFILLSSLIPEWNHLSAPLIANWFILLSLYYLLQLQTSTEPKRHFFNAAITLACTALLVPIFISLILLFFIAAIVSRPFKIKEWLVGLIGLITPYYFLAALFFLFGDIKNIRMFFPDDLDIITQFRFPNFQTTATFVFALLAIAAGFFFLNKNAEHMLTRVKNRWIIIGFGLFISLIPILLDNPEKLRWLYPSMIFLGLLAGNNLLKENKKWWNLSFFYLFIVIVLALQWIPF